MWVISFTPRPHYVRGKNLWYLLHRRLSETRNKLGRRGEEIILYHTETRTPTPGPSSPYRVAVPTSLPRLLELCRYFDFKVSKARKDGWWILRDLRMHSWSNRSAVSKFTGMNWGEEGKYLQKSRYPSGYRTEHLSHTNSDRCVHTILNSELH
jgi:hypothetical protein